MKADQEPLVEGSMYNAIFNKMGYCGLRSFLSQSLNIFNWMWNSQVAERMRISVNCIKDKSSRCQKSILALKSISMQLVLASAREQCFEIFLFLYLNPSAVHILPMFSNLTGFQALKIIFYFKILF